MPNHQLLRSPKASTFNWNLVKSVLLWGILIFLAILALRQYIAFNRDLSEELRRFRPIHWLFKRLGAFQSRLPKNQPDPSGHLSRTGCSACAGWRLILPGLGGEWDYVNPRRLTPRQKVIFYYLALVRRAREAGLPRQENQTPYEYARSLAASLAENQAGVDSMTEAFIEARYSRHDIPAKAARRTEFGLGDHPAGA